MHRFYNEEKFLVIGIPMTVEYKVVLVSFNVKNSFIHSYNENVILIIFTNVTLPSSTLEMITYVIQDACKCLK